VKALKTIKHTLLALVRTCTGVSARLSSRKALLSFEGVVIF